jgi:hypothetical protein
MGRAPGGIPSLGLIGIGITILCLMEAVKPMFHHAADAGGNYAWLSVSRLTIDAGLNRKQHSLGDSWIRGRELR